MRVGKVVMKCCIRVVAETRGLFCDADGGVEICQSLFNCCRAPSLSETGRRACLTGGEAGAGRKRRGNTGQQGGKLKEQHGQGRISGLEVWTVD